MLEVSAPLRIDLGGGETDVDYISKVIGTCIVNVGIDPYLDPNYEQKTAISCSANPASEFSLSYNEHEDPGEQFNELAFFRNILDFLSEKYELPTGAIAITDKLPKGTGLGGSSVLAICLVALANEINNPYLTNERAASEIIKTAHYIETVRLGLTGGFQDYVAGYFGRLNCIDFPSIQDVDFSNPDLLCGVEMESEIKKYLSNNLIVAVVNQANQSSSDILNDQIQSYAVNPTRMRRLLSEMKDTNHRMFPILSSTGNLKARLEQLGQMINHCWEIKKQLSPKVGAGLLSEMEFRVKGLTHAVTGPGAGGNSLVFLSKEASRQRLISALAEYSERVTLLFPRINETGIQVCKLKN